MYDYLTMTYDEYNAEYNALVLRFLGYSPNMVGSDVYASKLADLEEANPEHAAARDAEDDE